MRFILIASLWLCIVARAVSAEIPMPVRSNNVLLGAEHLVLCSDFKELSAARFSFFLSELGNEVPTVKVLNGPSLLSKANGFNVLAVISGTETLDSTKECALATAPYGDGIAEEISATTQGLLDGFQHPNPTIEAFLGDTFWVSSNYYHENENWITVVVAMRNPSIHQLDFTMMRLFGQPEDTCEQNLACLSP